MTLSLTSVLPFLIRSGELLRVYIMLLLSLLGGSWWAPVLLALHLVFASPYALQPVHKSRAKAPTAAHDVTNAADMVHAAEAQRASIPGHSVARLARQDVLWIAPRWLRFVSCALSGLQFAATLIASLVITLTENNAPTNRSEAGDTISLSRAALHTAGVYTLANKDKAWQRFVLLLGLSVSLVCVTVPLDVIWRRVLRANGKRLVTVRTSAAMYTAVPGLAPPLIQARRLWGLCPLLFLIALAAVMVPALDSLVLLLLFLVGFVFVGVLVQIFTATTTSTSTHRHRCRGADFQGLAIGSLWLCTGLFLLLHLVVSLPILVQAWPVVLDGRSRHGRRLSGTTSGWAALWRTENWLLCLGEDALAWRRLFQICLLLPVPFLTRHELAWCVARWRTRGQNRAASIASTAATHSDQREEPHTHVPPQDDSFPRHNRLSAVVRFVQDHVLVLIVVPVLLADALVTQDAVGLVLFFAAVMSLAWTGQRLWLFVGLLGLALVVAVLLLLIEYIFIALSPLCTSSVACAKAQRALFLHRHDDDTELLLPGSSRCVGILFFHVVAVSALLLGLAFTRRQHPNKEAALCSVRRCEQRVHYFQESYAQLIREDAGADTVGTQLHALAHDFQALLDEQAESPPCAVRIETRRTDTRQWVSGSALGSTDVLDSPTMMLSVVRSANARAVAALPDVPVSAELAHLLGTPRPSQSAAASAEWQAFWSSVWCLVAWGPFVPLSALMTSLGTSDSRLRAATWARLASPLERPLTSLRGASSSRRELVMDRDEATAETILVADSDPREDGADADWASSPDTSSHPTSPRRSARMRCDSYTVNRFLSLGSPGQGTLSLLDYIGLVDQLTRFHARKRCTRHGCWSWRAWGGLLGHIALTCATPVSLLVLFAATMTVPDLDTMNALYVIFFLFFIFERVRSGMLPTCQSTRWRWCRWGHRLFSWYLVVHILAVFTGHLVQTTYSLTPSPAPHATTLCDVLSLVGLFTDRSLGHILVYLLLLYLTRWTPMPGEASPTQGPPAMSLSRCIKRREWQLFAAQRRWQPVRYALRVGAMGLMLALMTVVLLPHSVLVLGLGVLYGACLLTTPSLCGAQKHTTRCLCAAWQRLLGHLHGGLLVLLTVYCPCVLLWLVASHFPRLREVIRDALLAARCDPRALGAYSGGSGAEAEHLPGSASAIPVLLLPWYLLCPLAASLLAHTRQQQSDDDGAALATAASPPMVEGHPSHSASDRLESTFTSFHTSELLVMDAFSLPRGCPRGNTAPRIPLCLDDDDNDDGFTTTSVRLAQHLLTALYSAVRRLSRFLSVLEAAALLQWGAQLGVALSNVSCLGVLYGFSYACDRPRNPLLVSIGALLHVLAQYVFVLVTAMRSGSQDGGVEGAGTSQATRTTRVLEYIGLHAPLSTYGESARYMLLPILVAVAALGRLGLATPHGDKTRESSPSTRKQASRAGGEGPHEMQGTCPSLTPSLKTATRGEMPSHEPVEYTEEETNRTSLPAWQNVKNYLQQRAFGDVVYEGVLLVISLGVALLADTVLSVALVALFVCLCVVGRVRSLTTSYVACCGEMGLLVLLLYAYVIELGVPELPPTHSNSTDTKNASRWRVPTLLQRSQHTHCTAWEVYAGCRLPSRAWVVLCVAALLQRLLRRHRTAIAYATLSQVMGSNGTVERPSYTMDGLFAQYDAAHSRPTRCATMGPVHAASHTMGEAAATALATRNNSETLVFNLDSLAAQPCALWRGDEATLLDASGDFSNASPPRPPPLLSSSPTTAAAADADPSQHIVEPFTAFTDAAAADGASASSDRRLEGRSRQSRILNALHTFDGHHDIIRDPHSPLQWCYAMLTQLLPASVLLFVHGVLLANIVGVAMATAALTLLCARRRLVERWTLVWRWLSVVLLLLLLPQGMWRLPVFVQTATSLTEWQVVVLDMCGVGQWPTRALVLHVLVLWSAVAVEHRLFNEFCFAPYLLGTCRASVAARQRRQRIRSMYQSRWKAREAAAQAQEHELHDTLRRLAASRQTTVEAHSHQKETPAHHTPRRRPCGVAARPLSWSEDASDREESTPGVIAQPRRGLSITFVEVESVAPCTQPALVTLDEAARARLSVGQQPPSPDMEALAEPQRQRLGTRIVASCGRTAQKLTRHLLAHSYQPDLPARLAQQHTWVALCIGVYRYGVRHSADLCFVLLLLNFALSGVVTDMLFSLTALLYSMVARPWAGRRYWKGLLFGLVISTTVKLIFQVIVTRFEHHTVLSPLFFNVVRVVVLDVGRGSEVSAGAMRTDILLDFACVFAVLGHIHASHDLGLFATPFQDDGSASVMSDPHGSSGVPGFIAKTERRTGTTLNLPGMDASGDRERDTDSEVRSRASSLNTSSSIVFVIVDREDGDPSRQASDDDEDNNNNNTGRRNSGETLAPAPKTRTSRGAHITDFLASIWRAVRSTCRQRRGRRGAGADHYTIQFWLDAAALILFCWAFFAIRYATTTTRNNVVRSLERNLLPGLFVVLLFVGVVLLCLERVVYASHHGLAKFALHSSLVLLYHVAFMVWRVEGSLDVTQEGIGTEQHEQQQAQAQVSNLTTASNAAARSTSVFTPSPSPLAPALTLLLVKLASAWVSAWQLRAGYPLMRRHDPFTARTDLFHWLGHMVARGTPFLLEIRLFLDWVVSATALKVQQWWLLEDIHHNIYLRCVDMSDINWTSRRKGRRFPLFVKLYQGVVGVLVVLATLFFPLFFYSTFSPQTQATLVSNWHVELTLQPEANLAVGGVVLYAADADVPRQTREQIRRGEPFAAAAASLPLLDAGFLSDARMIQTVSLPALSTAAWSVTSETLHRVVGALLPTSGDAAEVDISRRTATVSAVTLQVRFAYLSQTESDHTAARQDAATGLVGATVAITLAYPLPRASVQQLIAALTQMEDGLTCCTQAAAAEVEAPLRVDLPGMFYAQWINTGAALQPVTDTPGAPIRDCHLQLRAPRCGQDISWASLFYCDQGDEEKGAEGGLPFMGTSRHEAQDRAAAATEPRLLLLVRSLDATASTGLFGYFSNLGIIALYTTLVITLSNVLRSGISGGAHEVVIRQAANPHPITLLLRHIYWTRSSANNGHVDEALWLEQQLFLELVDLLRSPERLMMEGGRRVDDYDAQGIFRTHLVELAEKPFGD